jgi:aminoglycoside phosphotransferase (APT) family kinase protein
MTGEVAALDLSDSRGRRQRLVLKLYHPDPSEPDSAWREAHILELLAESDVPVPRVVAIDRNGALTGWPALLMTHMPGRRRMRPHQPGPWLAELKHLAERIHRLAVPHDALPRYRPWGLDDPLPVPGWWTNREVWLRAVEIFHGPMPDEPQTFIHRDFHPGNVLWTGERPSAIVDWLHGCLGPASVDYAHCRLNIHLDLGEEIGRRWPEVHQFWEIVDALSWVPDPKIHGIRRGRRYESFVSAAVARLAT